MEAPSFLALRKLDSDPTKSALHELVAYLEKVLVCQESGCKSNPTASPCAAQARRRRDERGGCRRPASAAARACSVSSRWWRAYIAERAVQVCGAG